jgi:hypothetical protein
MAKVAEAEGYNVTTKGVDFCPWHNFQRWLAAGDREVVIPFARTLARLIPAKAVRLRRDFGHLLRAIKAHALLHRHHRQRNENGAIVATIDDDYAAVRPLMSDLLAASAEIKVRAAIVETVAAVQAQQQTDSEHRGVNVREVAAALKLDRSAAWRRLRQAEDGGFVINVEQRRGHPGQYRATDESMPNAEMLPSVEALRTALGERLTHAPRNPVQRRNRGGLSI